MIATELSKSDLKKLQGHLEAIDAAKSSFNESVIVIGRELLGIRETVGAKDFVDYVQSNCRYSRSTAYNYIGAFEQFGNCKSLDFFEAKSLYLLAPNEAASKKAKELASKNQYIDEDKARGLLRNFKLAKEKQPVRPTELDESQTSDEPANERRPDPSWRPIEPKEEPEPEPSREPGDDTEAIKAEKNIRRECGREKVSSVERKKAIQAIGVIQRFVNSAKVRDGAMPHLDALLAIVKGA